MTSRNLGSFRDPSGHVYEQGELILRSVAPGAASEYEAAREILHILAKDGRIVDLSEIEADTIPGAAYVLRHPRLPMISYPYEWSFSLLREAALFHLDLHIDLLDRGFTLSDASAYNVQFVGPNPIFIDHLSVRRYQEGEFWSGHRQFCEQFLNPLLLRALFGTSHNAWYRGNLDGIPVSDLAKLLSLRHKLSWRIMAHVVLQDRLQTGALRDENAAAAKAKKRQLPLSGYQGLLRQLRNWIDGLSPDRIGRTVWGDYATTHTYNNDEDRRKRQFVEDFVRSAQPRSVIDLGCNTGDYSRVALEAGAERVLGFDFDQKALDQAHQRAKAESLNFLPLFLDAKNPSPEQGWMQSERQGLAKRANADAVLALAFEHHLAIAHNVPLEQVIQWIIGFAPAGVIEFVPKDDPTVRRMLAIRDDIFPDYTEENFSRILSSHRRIERQETVSSSGRVLYAFSS